METMSEVEKFLENPNELLDLLKLIIESLSSREDNNQITTMEAQLREISRAMEKLEKMGMVSPDSWRAEKTRLAATLGIQAESSKKLNLLQDGIEEILVELKKINGRNIEPLRRKRISKPHSTLPKTSKKVLRELIVEALHNLGGSAPAHKVINWMEMKLEGKLLPGDLEWRESAHEYAWKNNSAWERYAMTRDGILKSDSPKGIWELNEGPK